MVGVKPSPSRNLRRRRRFARLRERTMACIEKTAMRHKQGVGNRSDRNFRATRTSPPASLQFPTASCHFVLEMVKFVDLGVLFFSLVLPGQASLAWPKPSGECKVLGRRKGKEIDRRREGCSQWGRRQRSRTGGWFLVTGVNKHRLPVLGLPLRPHWLQPAHLFLFSLLFLLVRVAL